MTPTELRAMLQYAVYEMTRALDVLDSKPDENDILRICTRMYAVRDLIASVLRAGDVDEIQRWPDGRRKTFAEILNEGAANHVAEILKEETE